MKLVARKLATLATLGVLGLLAGSARADIIDPILNSGTSLNTDPATSPNNLFNNGGLSPAVNPGDTLAHAESVVMTSPAPPAGDSWQTKDAPPARSMAISGTRPRPAR